MAIKIEMLRCFCTVAETGTLAEAATRLGRTQSALSMTLKQLEDHLGQRLFESDRKNRMTPLGQHVFEVSRRQLRQYDEAVRAIETSASAPWGLLRVASVPSVAGLVFPRAIEAMSHRYPALKMELRDTDTSQVIDALLQGQADIGIASGRHTLTSIRDIPLFSDRFGLVCSPDHPLALSKKPPTIDDVVSDGFIRNNLCDLIGTEAFQTAIEGSRLTVLNTLSLITMVRTRKWVTVLPQTVERIMPADLVFRPIAGLPDRRQVSVLLRERSPFLKFAEELADLLAGVDWERELDRG